MKQKLKPVTSIQEKKALKTTKTGQKPMDYASYGVLSSRLPTKPKTGLFGKLQHGSRKPK